MESKIPEWFLSFYESLFSAQLRTVRQMKSPKSKKPKRTEGKSVSNMDMAIDILRRAQSPLHISEIIAQVSGKGQVQGHSGPGILGQRLGQKAPPASGAFPIRSQYL